MKLKDLKESRHRKYNSWGSLYCPALNKEVNFTAEGFFHLTHNSNGKPRTAREQYMKLEYVVFAPQVVKNAREVSTTRRFVKRFRGIDKTVIQYSLVYRVQADKKARVVVEKAGNGKIKFLSIMPNRKDSRHKKSTHR